MQFLGAVTVEPNYCIVTGLGTWSCDGRVMHGLMASIIKLGLSN